MFSSLDGMNSKDKLLSMEFSFELMITFDIECLFNALTLRIIHDFAFLSSILYGKCYLLGKSRLMCFNTPCRFLSIVKR